MVCNCGKSRTAPNGLGVDPSSGTDAESEGGADASPRPTGAIGRFAVRTR
jgi:hypothetical protein